MKEFRQHLITSVRVVEDRYELLQWDRTGEVVWIYDRAMGITRSWVLGFTLKPWTCFLTGSDIPANPNGELDHPGWAWRLGTPAHSDYLGKGRPKFGGEHRLRVARHVFERQPHEPFIGIINVKIDEAFSSD